MAKCTIFNKSPSYCYKHFKCRCSVCAEWKHFCELPRREKAREASRLWRLDNLERSRQNSRSYQQRHPNKQKEWQLKKYNLTLIEWDEIYNKQFGGCAICGNKDETKNHYACLSVDHNHKTGKVRGLLCFNCNTAIGKLQENAELFDRAKKYLEQTKE